MRKTRLTLLLAAGVSLLPMTSFAESLLMPDAAPIGQTAVAAPDGNVDGEVIGKSSNVSQLVPFENASNRFELTGEDDTAYFDFTLRPADIARGGKLMLAYKNAVSVLPDDAALAIELNGKDIGKIDVASPFDFTRVPLDVDTRILKVGRNTVKIRARQHHRVDCSMEATYELWTKIDSHQSGFEPRATQGYSIIEDLPQVGRMENGQTDLRLILPETATAEMINDALPLIQAVALYLNRQDVVVTISSVPGDGPGIDIFAGTDNTSRQTAEGVKILTEAPYGLSVTNSVSPDRARIILKGTSRLEMTAALLATVRGPMTEGLRDGIKAPQPGVLDVVAGGQYTLHDAGIRSSNFSGRLMRTKFEMVLPADFYPAEYATMDFKLRAATAPGLEHNAQLLLRVNDRIVNSFPFRNGDGEAWDGKLIELPLRAFRPGVNNVELLAELPRASDKTCMPDRGAETPRFILLDTTEILVPPMARITRLPDLGAFAGNAYPYANGKPFQIHVGQPDSHSVSAALTVLTRLAQTAKRPLKGEISFDPLSPDSHDNAIVISMKQDQAFLEGRRPLVAEAKINQDKSANKIVAQQTFKVDDEAAALLRTDVIRTAAINALPADPLDQHIDADALLESFQESTAGQATSSSWSGRLKVLFGIAGNRFGKWLNYQTEDGTVTLPEGQALMTLTQALNTNGDGVITTIVADNAQDLTTGVNRLAEPAIWSGLEGEAAVIEAKNMRLVTFAATDRHVLEVTDQSLSNYRRIAAAWFSDNFRFYVLMVIGLAGFLAWWLGRVVPTKGVRTDK